MKRALAVVAALLFVLASAPAGAQDVDRAKMYFNAGATAYSAGRYAVAIQAFEEAYKLAPREAIVFSMAQAYRKQYFATKEAPALKRAVDLYRDYLKRVPQGGRRADAVDALAQLEPLATRIAPDVAPTPPPVETKTRVMVSTQTGHAAGSLDGGPRLEMPIMEEVKPGKHKVQVSAPGYYDEEREIVAAQGGMVALDVTLREKPALLIIAAENGADLAVDGRYVGTTPLSQSLEIEAGTHYVTLTKTGYEAQAKEVTLERGQKKTIDFSLKRTTQRMVSYFVLGAGVVSAAAGVLFASSAFSQQSKAEDVENARQKGNISADQLDTYATSIEKRDQARTGAAISFGAAAAFATLGGVLYFFDKPTAILPTTRERQEPPKPATPPPARDTMEVSVLPFVGPTGLGAAVGGRF